MNVNFDNAERMDVVFTPLDTELLCEMEADDATFNAQWAESFKTPLYEGATEVTPSNVQQTLSTTGYRVPSDITINPIPSNYGLITWDGATLTVS